MSKDTEQFSKGEKIEVSDDSIHWFVEIFVVKIKDGYYTQGRFNNLSLWKYARKIT